MLNLRVAAGAPHDSPPKGGGGLEEFSIGTQPDMRDVRSVDSNLTSPVPEGPEASQSQDTFGRPLHAGSQLPVGSTNWDWWGDATVNTNKNPHQMGLGKHDRSDFSPVRG